MEREKGWKWKKEEKVKDHATVEPTQKKEENTLGNLHLQKSNVSLRDLYTSILVTVFLDMTN